MAGTLRPRRFLRRRELITLSLNGREVTADASPFSPDPEVTHTDVCLSRLGDAHNGRTIFAQPCVLFPRTTRRCFFATTRGAFAWPLRTELI